MPTHIDQSTAIVGQPQVRPTQRKKGVHLAAPTADKVVPGDGRADDDVPEGVADETIQLKRDK